MNFLKKLFGIKNTSAKEKDTIPNTFGSRAIPDIAAKGKTRGVIRYVLLVVSHPTQPTTAQMSSFVTDILPEFAAQENSEAKLGLLWKTDPINSIDINALAAKTFGNSILDADKHTYRTLVYKLNGGESKCLVVYDVVYK